MLTVYVFSLLLLFSLLASSPVSQDGSDHTPKEKGQKPLLTSVSIHLACSPRDYYILLCFCPFVSGECYIWGLSTHLFKDSTLSYCKLEMPQKIRISKKPIEQWNPIYLLKTSRCNLRFPSGRQKSRLRFWNYTTWFISMFVHKSWHTPLFGI